MKCAFRVAAAVLLAVGLPAGSRADTDRLLANATRYDQEYPVIDYSGPATHNAVWRLQQRLDSGEARLDWEPRFGYLRSLLKALQIDVDSQVLVFSKTSLQFEHISAATPRALYFNDSSYVGYVQGSNLLEFAVIDANLGPVYFMMDNRLADAQHLEREGGRCLTCHDTYSMMGGGVPRMVVMSSPVDDPTDQRNEMSATEVDDRTPVDQRWGGWYVTGHNGAQAHFGNLPLREDGGQQALRDHRHARQDLETLAGYFDTSAYLSGHSDIAALLVLEHQSFVQNLMTRANYKVRTLLARDGSAQASQSWVQLTPEQQKSIKAMTEPLVRALFLADAVRLDAPIESGSGFAERFAALGPRDRDGRSLRELDLTHHLLRHPLSFQIYSEQFDALPRCVLDYIGMRVGEVLGGTDTSGISQQIAPAERAVITQILADTKPGLIKGPQRR